MKKLLIFLALATGMSFAQGVRYDSNVTTSATNVPVGASAPVLTLPYASVTVCGYPATPSTGICTNTVPIYSDQGLTQSLLNPLQADSQGRFGFWIAPGTYSYSVQTSGGTVVGTFALSLNSPQGVPGPAGPTGATISCGGSSGCTTPGPFIGQTINGTRYAGQIYSGSTTIQAAVTDAADVSPVGDVAIPFSYAGTDTYNNPNGLKIEDKRRYEGDPTLLRMSTVLALMTEANHGDSGQAQKCAVTLICKVVYWGDSITEGIYGIANEDSWAWQTFRMLQQAVPQVGFTGIDLGIGGTNTNNALDATYTCETSGTNTFFRAGTGNGYLTWPVPCTIGESWKQHIADQSPDIVFLAFGQNDLPDGGNNFASNMLAIITYLQTLPKPPTIVLVTTYPPTLYTPPYNNELAGLVVGQVVRELANRYGLMLLDAGRLMVLDRDGYDPARYPMNYEGNWTTYPTGWATLQGTAGTLSGSVLTVPSGGGLYSRQRDANDVVVNALFSSLTSGATPTVLYRSAHNDTTGAASYKVQAAFSGSTWTVSLYVGNAFLTSGTCSGTSSSINLLVRAIGSKHEAYCNGSNTPLFANTGNGLPGYADYQNPGGLGATGAGYYAIGILNSGGTITESTYVGGDPDYTTYPVSEQALLGVYSAADTSNGDFFVNPYSLGGNGINHPSRYGHDAYYTAAALPVILQLQQDMRQYFVLNAQQVNANIVHAQSGGVVAEPAVGASYDFAVHNAANTANTFLVNENGSVVATSASFLITASVTTTAATSDVFTVSGMASSGHCTVTPTDSSASANIATTYVSAKAANSVTLAHAAIAGMTFDLNCVSY